MIDFIEAIKTSFQVDKRYNDAVKRGYHPIDKRLYKAYNSFRPNGAKPIFCYLPFNSLTFSFGGQVFVCGYNRDVKLGQYPTNTIDEIWNGPNAQKLREHLLNNDLEFGCRHCKYFFDKEKFTNLRPLVFDKYYQNTEALFPQVFEFEISNECNLECQMCSGEVSSSIRKNRDHLPAIPSPYDDAFVEQLVKYIPHLKEAKFYGGEPFLIPVYYKIWDKVKDLNPKLELFTITNGTHWNSKIEKLINELNFDLAVSIDAVDKEKLERIRKNATYEKVMENIKRFSEVCTRKGKHLSLSFTVQKDNWEQLPLIINLCNDVNAYIYVSYLERPIRFALTDYSSDELRKIRVYMNQFSFPVLTQKERHNKKCFEDFVHYLDTYIENANQKKYHQYDFDRGLLLAGTTVAKENTVNKINSIETDVWMRWVDTQYESRTELTHILPKEIFISKFESVTQYYSEYECGLLRNLMMSTGFDQILDSVQNFSVEELVKLSSEVLREYQTTSDKN